MRATVETGPAPSDTVSTFTVPRSVPCPVDTDRFAGLGIRFGAALLDVIVVVVLVLIVVAIAFGSSDDDGDFEAFASGGEAIVVGVIVWALYSVLLVVQLGGTPGKVMLGLRITEEDGRTPVTYRSAAMRALPGLLSNVIPVVGSLIALAAAIASIVMISNDPERRSAYDRIGSTRVVRKSAL